MAVSDQIERIKTNIANAYTTAESIGATIPELQNSENLSTTIGTIPTGGGSPIVKGLIIDEVDDNGFVIAAHIEGMENIPSYYCYQLVTSTTLFSKATVTIGEGTRRLGNSSFGGSQSFTQPFVLPNTIEYIDTSAFTGNRMMKWGYLKLPSALTYLGSFAFYNNTKLEGLTIPEGVTAINSSLCAADTALKRVYIKGDITTIASQAFASCPIQVLVLSGITSAATLSSELITNTTGLENPADDIAGGLAGIYVPDDIMDAVITAWIEAGYGETANQVAPLSTIQEYLTEDEIL